VPNRPATTTTEIAAKFMGCGDDRNAAGIDTAGMSTQPTLISIHGCLPDRR
jgi:hypothetical protein